MTVEQLAFNCPMNMILSEEGTRKIQVEKILLEGKVRYYVQLLIWECSRWIALEDCICKSPTEVKTYQKNQMKGKRK